jgi:hypothetical protein
MISDSDLTPNDTSLLSVTKPITVPAQTAITLLNTEINVVKTVNDGFLPCILEFKNGDFNFFREVRGSENTVLPALTAADV